MLKSLKAKSMKEDAQLAIMGHPWPSGPLVQSLPVGTHSVSIRLENSAEFALLIVYADSAPHADGVDDMRILARNGRKWIFA